MRDRLTRRPAPSHAAAPAGALTPHDIRCEYVHVPLQIAASSVSAVTKHGAVFEAEVSSPNAS